MEKILLLLFCVAILFVGCDMLPSSKKEKEAEEKRIREEQFQEEKRKRRERETEWLNQNRKTAENTVIQFAKKEGYSIQSIECTGGNHLGGNIGNFSFNITTGNTSQTGGLIWIIANVECKGSTWIISYFSPRTY